MNNTTGPPPDGKRTVRGRDRGGGGAKITRLKNADAMGDDANSGMRDFFGGKRALRRETRRRRVLSGTGVSNLV